MGDNILVLIGVGLVALILVCVVVDRAGKYLKRKGFRHPDFWAHGIWVGGLVVFVTTASITMGVLAIVLATATLFIAAKCRRDHPPLALPGKSPMEHDLMFRMPPAYDRGLRTVWALGDLAFPAGLTVRDTVATDMLARVNDASDIGSVFQIKKAHDLRKDPSVRIHGNTVWRIPTVAQWFYDDKTTTVFVRLPAGLLAEDAAKAGPALAAEYRAHRVTLTQSEHEHAAGVVRITVMHEDPLSGVRRTEHKMSKQGVQVGRLQDGGQATVALTDASHVAIQGMTRSGKSAHLYTLLAPLAEDPSVVVGGIDPNRVLLSPWQHVERSKPWLSLGSDATSAADVLAKSVAELDRRMDILDDRRIEKLETFTDDLPLLVFVLEEYPALLTAAATQDSGAKPADRQAPRIKSAVSRLVMEGAKVGIRVILIAQRMDASIVDDAVRGQFGTRVTFGVDNREAVQMLHPEATPETIAQVVAFPPGRALFWKNRQEAFMQGDLADYQDYWAKVAGEPATKSHHSLEHSPR